MNANNEIILYQSDNAVQLEVLLENETVWLTLNQMSDLFERDKSVISRHISNIFKEEELNKNSVVAKNATTASDGKIYLVEYYNLDVIISVGYRVKSRRGYSISYLGKQGVERLFVERLCGQPTD